ncbi:MAG: T9SS type A sorting domain-containing protein, partial [Muribaculaceae bacterium]|nr:T9SS type A sorting domain-containing protein [Muribaculaceae bacterium]
GAQGIRMSELSAEYSNYSGVDAVKSGTLPNTTVYPNPVTDGVFTVVSSVEIENVSVYSLTGIEMENVKGTGCSAMTVNVRHFPAGVYFARVSTAIGENAIKLIIK